MLVGLRAGILCNPNHRAEALAEVTDLLRKRGASMTPRALILGDAGFLKRNHGVKDIVTPRENRGWLLVSVRGRLRSSWIGAALAAVLLAVLSQFRPGVAQGLEKRLDLEQPICRVAAVRTGAIFCKDIAQLTKSLAVRVGETLPLRASDGICVRGHGRV